MSMTAAADADVHRRRWWILSVLCLSVLLAVVDNTIVNVALPTMSRQLSASTQGLQWIVGAYSPVFPGPLLVGGDLRGRGRGGRGGAGVARARRWGPARAALGGPRAPPPPRGPDGEPGRDGRRRGA